MEHQGKIYQSPKMEKMENKNRSAFPPLPSYTDDESGLSKLEYDSIHSTYDPSEGDIATILSRDRNANPHNEDNKKKIRSKMEIINFLIIENAKELLKQLSEEENK